MCPFSRTCKGLVTYLIATEILLCNIKKEDCPYIINKEPDEPVKKILHEIPLYDGVVVASGSASALEISTSIGSHIYDYPNGRKLFFVKPQDINTVGGAFRIVHNDGKETIINFEIPEV